LTEVPGTDTFRYTEYTNEKGKLLSRMLYDHKSDPDENLNLTSKDDAALSRQLHQLMGRDNKKP